MTTVLRVEMVLVSLIFFIGIIRAINRGVFLLTNAIQWLLLTCSILVCAIFPQIPIWLAGKLGFETTSNFILLAGLLILLIIEIRNSVTISKQQRQLKTVIQELSMMKSEQEEK